jgi:hypothetical protein
MRNLLALAAAIVVIIAVVGWYQGWYRVETEPAADGHREVTIDINGAKVGEDLNKGKAKVKEILGHKGTTPGSTSQAPPAPPPPAVLQIPGPPSGTDGVNQASWTTLPDLSVPAAPGGQVSLPPLNGQLPPAPPGGPVLAPPPPPSPY